jgi:hypothetical protein
VQNLKLLQNHLLPVGRDCKNDGFSIKGVSFSSRKNGICVFEILTFDNSALSFAYCYIFRADTKV